MNAPGLDAPAGSASLPRAPQGQYAATPVGEKAAFHGGTRWHVLNDHDSDHTKRAFSFCGVFVAGQSTISASEVRDEDRCGGRCKGHWPTRPGSSAANFHEAECAHCGRTTTCAYVEEPNDERWVCADCGRRGES